MVKRFWAVVALFVLAAPAAAETFVAVRPGLMCRSAEALAQLTLPDGSPRDLARARASFCLPLPDGARLQVRSSQRNTSVVLYDAHDGTGPRPFIIPNIDVRPLRFSGPALGPKDRATAPPPQPGTLDAFWHAVEQTCPDKPWRGSIGGRLAGPLDTIPIPEPRRAALEAEIERACADTNGITCPSTVTIKFLLAAGEQGQLVQAYCEAEPE